MLNNVLSKDTRNKLYIRVFIINYHSVVLLTSKSSTMWTRKLLRGLATILNQPQYSFFSVLSLNTPFYIHSCSIAVLQEFCSVGHYPFESIKFIRIPDFSGLASDNKRIHVYKVAVAYHSSPFLSLYQLTVTV